MESKSLPIWRRSLACEACGAEFTCGAGTESCWCAEVEVSEAVRAKLRARFGDCLCRRCLERFAAERVESSFT